MTEHFLLNEQGGIHPEIVVSLMAGDLVRGDVVRYRQLELTPTRDYSTIFLVSTADGREIDVVNAGAARASSELVRALHRIQEHVDEDDGEE